MTRKLVVGGAGFIGSWIVQELVDRGADVTVLDRAERPDRLLDGVRYLQGDAGDPDTVEEALHDVGTVFILAGRTGIGDSVEHPDRYYRDNAVSLLPLLRAVAEDGAVDDAVAASSMHVYGEGRYRCDRCGARFPSSRSTAQLEAGAWAHTCSCGATMQPVPLREEDPVRPRDPYGRSKRVMECIVSDIPADTATTVLRYPVVYGPRQGGAMDYFFSAAMAGGRPRLFEDGRQQRDFMFVKDVAAATVDAVNAAGGLYNLGTGDALELRAFVSAVMEAAGNENGLNIPGGFRAYDVRHTIPDASRSLSALDIRPTAPDAAIQNTLEYYR